MECSISGSPGISSAIILGASVSSRRTFTGSCLRMSMFPLWRRQSILHLPVTRK
jgi:hypothetical protein